MKRPGDHVELLKMLALGSGVHVLDHGRTVPVIKVTVYRYVYNSACIYRRAAWALAHRKSGKCNCYGRICYVIWNYCQ